MPDSNITKRALADSLKELLTEASFSKISIGNICEKCGMNRKSFYYHFKDKYDLVNWIYYTEFISIAKEKNYNTEWEAMEDICIYYYGNRNFYRKILKVEGQNPFSSYFRELLLPVISEYLKEIFNKDENWNFYVDFFADAFTSAIMRWLLDKECMPPDKFITLLKSCVWNAAKKVMESIPEDDG